jgi:hypothetical protein
MRKMGNKFMNAVPGYRHKVAGAHLSDSRFSLPPCGHLNRVLLTIHPGDTHLHATAVCK